MADRLCSVRRCPRRKEPLTLTLSPSEGEREQVTASVENSRALGSVHSLRRSSKSPKLHFRTATVYGSPSPLQ
jgi:hypothetical protein